MCNNIFCLIVMNTMQEGLTENPEALIANYYPDGPGYLMQPKSSLGWRIAGRSLALHNPMSALNG